MKISKKPQLICLIILTFSIYTEGQTFQSTCTAPQTVIENLSRSATDLAVTRLYQIKSPDTVRVIVPKIHVDSTISALIAVFNLKNLPQRDTIFDLLKINAGYPDVTVFSIASFDTSWTNRWAKLQTLTGFGGIDSLLNRYKLGILSYNKDLFTLGLGRGYFQTAMLINAKAFSDSVKTIKSVRDANVSGSFDRPKINLFYEIEPNGNKIITFNYRWGEDCQAGCEKSRRWKFRIYPDCKVEYLGVAGRLLDFVLSESKELNQTEAVQIYPNPTQSRITISGKSDFRSYEITNISGQSVKTGAMNGSPNLDVSELPEGIYLLKLTNPNTKTSAVGKFIVKY